MISILTSYARVFVGLLLAIAYLIPTGFAALHGHGRNGYVSWVDTMGVDTPVGICIWTAVLIWLFYPILYSVKEMIWPSK